MACAALAVGLMTPAVLAMGAPPEFTQGEIIIKTNTWPDGSGGNTQAIVSFDPVSKTVRLVYDFPGSYGNDITYDPFRDAIIAKELNQNEFTVIDAAGNASTFDPGTTFARQLAARGDGKIYYRTGNEIGYIDETNAANMLLTADGSADYVIVTAGSQLGDSMYYDARSNSLYLDRNSSLAPGIDEDFLVKLELSADGTRVLNETAMQVNTNPTNVEVVSVIGPGRQCDDEVYFSLDVNNNGLWGRGWVANTETLGPLGSPTVFFESGFFRAAGTDYGVYSPLTGTAIVYASPTSSARELWEYSFGTVDLLGSPANSTPVSFIPNHMLVIELRDCPADLSGDGILDLTDINIFVNGFVDQTTSLADLGAPCDVFDLGDINAFVSGFLTGCP